MNKKATNAFLLLCCFCFLLFSFQKENDKVKKAVEEALTEFKKKKAKECHAKLLKQASTIADSVMLDIAKLSKRDSSKRIRIPRKPNAPKIRTVDDTSPIEPLWPILDSLYFDSLFRDSIKLDSIGRDSLSRDTTK